MEKVLAVYGLDGLDEKKMQDVNKHLEKGWTVKSITMEATNTHMTAIFLLEK